LIALRRYLGVTGFLVGGVGAALEQPIIVWAAILLLSASLVLRLVAAFRHRRSASRSDTLSASVDE
jgi:hypothetical protein